jgi:hypothetical protein
VPNSDPPPENEAILALAPILAPTLIEPLREVTLDLSPLSNPYDCRVEWFDTLGNSLGYVPPPPSPPRRPPPPPSPPRHRVDATSAPSPLPSSSSNSPLSPHSAPRATGVPTEKRSWLHCATSPGDMRKSSLHFWNCRRRKLNDGAGGHFDVLSTGPMASNCGSRQGQIEENPGLRGTKARSRFLVFSCFRFLAYVFF